jgi:SET and MYND domain-containing protein
LTIVVFTKQWYINVLARIRVNAFRIELVASSYKDLLSSAIASVASDASVGNAVYMLPSFYNHDCGMALHMFIS